MSFYNTTQYDVTPDLYLPQSSAKRAQKGGHLLTNLGRVTHLIEQSTLASKQVYPEVKHGDRIGEDEVTIWFLGNGEQRHRVVLVHRLDETTEPRHVLLSQNLDERFLQFIVLLQGVFKKLHSFKGASEAFLNVNHSGNIRLIYTWTYLQYEKRTEIPAGHLPLTLRASDLFLTLRNGGIQSI